MGKSKKNDNSSDKVNDRVADYRVRTEREGLKRVETTVSAEDASLIKDVAKVLRAGGPVAEEIRATLRSTLPATQARTGQELLSFFGSSPLRTDDAERLDEVERLMDIERDRTSGRTADFE